MIAHGHVAPVPEARTLEVEFGAVDEPTATTVFMEGMKNSVRSQERENDLTRLISTIQPLDQAADASLAMNFFYRTQCEAKAGDIELRFKAAIHRCQISRFSKILRAAPHTAKGWDEACIAVLLSIDRHYLASAKVALWKEMNQRDNEDPSIYADRVLFRADVYKHFAELVGKVVDEAEVARKWIEGLVPRSVRQSASVAVHNMSVYTITDALDVARVAHASGVSELKEAAPLQSLGPTPPGIDAGYLQQCMSQMETRMADMVSQGNSDMFDRMALMQTSNATTKFPCVAPACKGALHKFKDCPVRAQCRHCPTPGHHSEGCYKQFPRLDHRPMDQRSGGNDYRTRDRTNRGRDQDRGRERDRSPDQRKTRERERERDSDRGISSSTKDTIRSKDGKRLNEKGPR